MKLKSTLVTCLLALGTFAVLRAQDIKLNIPGQTPTPAPAAPAAAAAAAAPAAPATKYTDAQLLEEYGWFIGKRIGLSDLNFSPEQVNTVLKGITAASQGKATPFELEKIGPVMDEFIKAKQNEFLAKVRAKGLAESAAFLTELKKKAGVTVLPSGLVYEILKPGTGPAPTITDTLTVNYTGALVDGSVFSSTQGAEPASLPLDKMIPGWIEGMQKTAKGGKIRLYIPPDLAFGDEVHPGIPPASTLVFEIELLDIKPTPPAPMPAPEAAPAPKGK